MLPGENYTAGRVVLFCVGKRVPVDAPKLALLDSDACGPGGKTFNTKERTKNANIYYIEWC
jgi:hypothetical protein